MNRQTFQNPPREFREIPFWSWNDTLNPEELRRQIRLMAEGGWGGFFMHSRTGLQTPYLGPAWFDCVRVSVEEARSRGLHAWLYDEDKWPSGFAGGTSVAANPDYRAKCLVCKVDNRPNLLAERLATFSARETGGRLQEISLNPAPEFTSSEDRLIQFYPLTASLGNPTFNDYTYVDLLNAQAVRAFLDSTHEIYARYTAEEFGQTIPGVFTDEPCLQFHLYVYGDFGYQATDLAIPWTQDLPADFEAQNGYALLPRLPALFFDTGDYRPVRYDFYRTVTRLFTERYTKQVSAWCAQHGLKLTGHFMGEDTLLWQIPWVGSAMPHMAWMQVPGVDKLGRNVNGLDGGMVLTVKQLDSIVCQTGKERALCENYGCTGQDFAHTGRKWIGDWAYVLGINLNNPHLALYSLRGERKRDCPPNLFFQQPWWPENRLISEYFARLSYVLSQGTRCTDILVIHPIGSAWAVYRPGASAPVVALDQSLNALLLTLMQSQRDFHLADEGLMEPGEPCEAQVVAAEGGPRLAVGQMAYRLVIVPASITLSKNTVRLLAEFSAAGGCVLAMEPLPTCIDGREASASVLPENSVVVSCDTLPAALDEYLPFDVRIPARPHIWAHHRDVQGTQVYFLANTDLERGCPATVQVRRHGRVEVWDAATGSVADLAVRTQGELTEIDLDFAPAGAHLLVVHPDETPTPAAPQSPARTETLALENDWQIVLDEPNALVLDTARVQIEGREWSPPLHILDAHQMVARAGSGTHFSLIFGFDVDEVIAGPMTLVVESPGQHGLCVNGQTLDGDQDQGWWIDPAFRRLDITSTIHLGRNEVRLSGPFTRITELESLYVIGHFGVTSRWLRPENRLAGQDFDRYGSEFHLYSLPKRLTTPGPAHPLECNLTASGFPFFAGRITLTKQVQLSAVSPQLHLEFDRLHAAVVHAKVNGHPVGTAAWPPYTIPLADHARIGTNTVEVELVGTLRNLLGPHHLAGGDPNRTNPEEFRNKAAWTDDYILTPFGWEEVRLCW